MLTRAEKGYLAMTLVFLAAGSGIKAYRHASIRLGPFSDPVQTASLADAAPKGSGNVFASDSPAASAGQASGADSSSADGIPPDRIPSGIPILTNSDTALSSRTRSDAPLRDGPGSGKSRSHPRAGKSAFAGKVNINSAGEEELTQVHGLGGKTARAIVQYRKTHGPYRELRDLLQVKGIGEKKLEKLEPYLIL